MADLMKAKENLEARGYAVRLFPDKESAAKYLNEVIDGTSVGFGGSMTLDQMGLFPSLGQHNTVFWHWKQNPADARASAANAAVYLSSVNALAETGEIVNIDGRRKPGGFHPLWEQESLPHHQPQQAGGGL